MPKLTWLNKSNLPCHDGLNQTLPDTVDSHLTGSDGCCFKAMEHDHYFLVKVASSRLTVSMIRSMHYLPSISNLLSCVFVTLWEVFILLSLQKAKDKKTTIPQSSLINLSRKIYLTLFLFKIKAIYNNTFNKRNNVWHHPYDYPCKKFKILHDIKPCDWFRELLLWNLRNIIQKLPFVSMT